MKTYRLQLKIRSPLATPLQGDTLFGHLCWGIAYHEGENELTKFLTAYDGEIPLAVSNGFPHDKLSMPILKPVIPDNVSLEKIKILKRLKKMMFIPMDLFFNKSFLFSQEQLLQHLPPEGKEKEKKNGFVKNHHTRNTINRATGMVEEGGLYTVSEDSPTLETEIMDIYVATTLSESRVSRLFKWGLEFGYGADKSTGKGAIDIDKLESISFPTEGNRCMALGNFVPGPADNLGNIRADLITKFGKLGGHFVTSMNPFKKPILMFKAGTTFESKNCQDYVGTSLKNIHKDPRIRHHALAPVIRYHEEVLQ